MRFHLLAYAVNFAVHVTSHNHLAYVVSGIRGGFRGEFSIPSRGGRQEPFCPYRLSLIPCIENLCLGCFPRR
jgi:hypothetical protein